MVHVLLFPPIGCYMIILGVSFIAFIDPLRYNRLSHML